MEYPCHSLPHTEWCDAQGPGGFMGHTCIKTKPVEKNYIGKGRVELSDKEIETSIRVIREKVDIRLIQKHRGSYMGNHESYGILAEEFNELLDALHSNDNEGFYAELIDIAVGAILAMASMYANKIDALKSK